MNEKTKLFCLPYAGGSAHAIYGNWQNLLEPQIELYPIELAGRGARIGEPLYTDIEEAATDILQQIKGEIVDANYAFFGHSTGSMLAYKVLRKIDDLKLPPPIHAFFSGRRAPHSIGRKTRFFSKMSDTEFERMIYHLGTTPTEFFKYPELSNIFIPSIKSDFTIADTIVDAFDITPFDFDISFFLGNDEDILISEVMEWMSYTIGSFSVDYFKGGHFFLLDQPAAVVETITSKLIHQSLKVAV